MTQAEIPREFGPSLMANSGQFSWGTGGRGGRHYGSFRRRLVLSFVTLAMLVVGGSGWILYERALESLEAQLSSRLVAEVRLIANGLPTGIARFVRPGFEGFPYYQYHTKWLRESQQMVGARRVYVFDKDCRSLLDTEPGIPIGRQYSIVKYRDRALVDDIWQGQASHTMRFKEPETGVDIMTGYAPMLN
jgi:hypothetical protein